jgi:hypothetical protein
MRDLLASLDLSPLLVNSLEDCEVALAPIEYVGVSVKLNEAKQRSTDFLTAALSSIIPN